MPSESPRTPPPAPPPGPGERTGTEVAGAARRFGRPRRLHPASVLLGINLRQLIQTFLFPAAASFAAGGRTMIVVMLLVGVIGLVVRVLAWQRFHYSFDGEVLRVSEGVLSRNHRVLDVARIQQVEIDRTLAQRLLGLAALRVETAGSSTEVEVELRVVPEDEAVALRTAVRESKVQVTGAAPEGERAPGTDDQPAPRVVLRVPLRHVVLGAVTGVRLLVFPAVIAGAFQFLGQATDRWIDRAIEIMLEHGVGPGEGVPGLTLGTGLLLAGAVLALSLVTAVAVGVLRDARFRIERTDEDLHVSRGLLSTRDSVLPLRRIQHVQVHRNWIRRSLGYGSVRILSAGGSGDTDRRVTVPLLPEAAVEGLLREVCPGIDGVPELTAHPRVAVRRAVFRWLRAVSLPIVALWVIPWDLLEPARGPSLILLPLAVVLGIVEYRHLAHGIGDRLVVSRQGALSVTTSLAPLVKVQAVSTRANLFQRRLGLATVRAHVAGPGGDVEVLDCGARRARELHTLLTRRAADPSSIEPGVEETAPGR